MKRKRVNLGDEEAVEKSIKEAIERFWPKPPDDDYWGPVGGGWFKLGGLGYCGKGAYDLLQKEVIKAAKQKADERESRGSDQSS